MSDIGSVASDLNKAVRGAFKCFKCLQKTNKVKNEIVKEAKKQDKKEHKLEHGAEHVEHTSHSLQAEVEHGQEENME
ncbi:hypothetical protein Bpfe_007173 [Biomphalaria pfeifferi]|uniref:Uncharacterized protein n=1 Tax=Biomphalaria pfeifferi TaxID=112525 RepID=A0AAD8C0L9_BIOPF|nr:hypothetical protein Bpfe_007173 [Biomphalaria pfeifferi]